MNVFHFSQMVTHLIIYRFFARNSFYLIVFSLCFTMHNFCLAQQISSKEKLTNQLVLLDSAFRKGDIECFNQIVENENLKELFASVVEQKIKREPGRFRIISIAGKSAYVFVSGLFLYGNSGDETNLSTKYTGLYRFAESRECWRLVERVEIDRLNMIKKQSIDMVLNPESDVKIIDTLTIDINDRLGFAVKLNHTSMLQTVSLNGSAVDFVFSSGMLWINSRPRKNLQLIIAYSIKVERDEKNINTSYFGPSYGHLRNQYFWHPFFGFSSPNDRAEFWLRCQIPKSFQLATSLPQRDGFSGDRRIIFGRSEIPTFGLSIYYDRNWELRTLRKDQIDMVIYATADFAPGYSILYDQFSKDYDILKGAFGKPISNYFGIVQDRTGGNGWKNRANSVVVAGKSGSYLITDKPNPRAVFGHEVAHGWTSPTGPATNFLMEGWATYAESVLMRQVYGDSILIPFFQSQKQNYLNGGFDGKKNLWEDYSNSGISYAKGAWLFYMLETQMGREKFSAGMREFIGEPKHTIQAFIKEMSRAAGRNMEPFLHSWLKSKQIPCLKVQVFNSRIDILQEGDPLLFQLDVQILLKDGTRLSRTLDFKSARQSWTIDEGEIVSWIIDPNKRLLHQLKL